MKEQRLSKKCEVVRICKGSGIEEINFYVEGKRVGVEIFQNGKRIERHNYSENGEILKAKILISDGKVKERQEYSSDGKLKTVHIFTDDTIERRFYTEDGENIAYTRVFDTTERLISSNININKGSRKLEFTNNIRQSRIFLDCSLSMEKQTLSVEKGSAERFREFLLSSKREGILVLGLDLRMEGTPYHSLLIACETKKDGSRIFFLLDTNDTNRFSNIEKGMVFTGIPLVLYDGLFGFKENNGRLIYLERQIQLGGTCLESSYILQDLIFGCVASEKRCSIEDIKMILEICTYNKREQLTISEKTILSQNPGIAKRIAECMQENSKYGIFEKEIEPRCELVLKYISTLEVEKSKIGQLSKIPSPQTIPQNTKN